MPSHEECKEILYERPIPKFVQNWFDIQAPCRIYNLLMPQDIAYLNQIATSVKLSGNPSKKKELITRLMEQRGFKKLDCGTNRIVYKFMEDQSFLIKVAFDRVAIQDNLKEYKNQEFLKPFCAKCFEVSPCGTVGMFERVNAVKTREQFAEIANRVFDIIVNCFIGKYVLADFGTNFYKNWGVRKGAYPVILDYPYLYELDSAKLYCNNRDLNSPTGYCGGEIDYDDGFNFLVCKKCGKVFLASELGRNDNKPGGLCVEREENYMNITIERSNGKTVTFGEEKKTTTYKKLSRREYNMKKKAKNFDFSIEIGDHSEIKDKPVIEVPRVLTEKESHIEKSCKELSVTIKKGNDYYVGNTDTPVKINPYAEDDDLNIYGSGAKLEEPEDDSKEYAKTVYSDSDNTDNNFNSTLAAALMSIAGSSDKNEEDEPLDNTISNKDHYNVSQKYDDRGNMISVDDPNDPEYDELSDTPPTEYDSDDEEEDIDQEVLDEYY